MSLFEYLTAAYVLLLSFALLRALSALPHVIMAGSRYWVHVLWLVAAFANCLVSFWAFWSYRDVEWTLPKFAAVLAIPSLLFVYNSILVPASPGEVSSYREHYFRVRVPLFAAGFLMVAVIMTTNALVVGTPFFSPVVYGGLLWLSVHIVGLATAIPRVHAGLAIVTIALFVVSVSTLVAEPAPLIRAR